MDKIYIKEKMQKYINRGGMKSFIVRADSALSLGVIITAMGCFFPMVVRYNRGNSAGFFSDVFDNGFLGLVGSLWYGALSGDFNKTTMDTVGIFTGSVKTMGLAGITLIVWGILTLLLLRKNRLVLGLLASCQILFLNFVLQYYFTGFKGMDGTYLYTTHEYSYGWGKKLFVVGAVLLLIGIVRTSNVVKKELSQILVFNRAAKILLGALAFTVFAFIRRTTFLEVTSIVLFNAAIFYFFKPHLSKQSERKNDADTDNSNNII